jgi:hypothetical protein
MCVEGAENKSVHKRHYSSKTPDCQDAFLHNRLFSLYASMGCLPIFCRMLKNETMHPDCGLSQPGCGSLSLVYPPNPMTQNEALT